MAKVVLISGEEDFLAERVAFEEASMFLPEETLEFDFPEDLQKYLDESQTPSISRMRRAYIVWDAISIPQLPIEDDDLLVVVSKKPIPYTNAKRILKFNKLKYYSDNNEVIRWILQEGERKSIDLTRVAAALFVNHKNGLRKISSEIDKLAVLTPPGTQVTPEVAKSVLCFSAELTPKNIIESICEGHTVKALAFYERLQSRNDETGWIIAYLQRHVSTQLRTNVLLRSGMSIDRASSVVGINTYVLSKTYADYIKLWSDSSLVRSLDTLCDLDVLHKKGVNVNCSLELEIINLSEEAHGCLI